MRFTGGLHHALVPLSYRFVGIAIGGPHAAELLAAGCPLDLHSRVFGPGTVTRTLLGKAEIILHRPEAGSGFCLYVARSFAPQSLALARSRCPRVRRSRRGCLTGNHACGAAAAG
jgi:heterotetrameric sarcosine oxidase gamma subunit